VNRNPITAKTRGKRNGYNPDLHTVTVDGLDSYLWDRDRSVIQHFPDAPIVDEDLRIPGLYLLTQENTQHFVPGKGENGEAVYETVAEAPIIIVKRLRDVDTGDVSLEVAWLREDKQWQQITVSRGMLVQSREIVGLAGKGFPVSSVNANGIIRYLTFLGFSPPQATPFQRQW